MYECKLEVIQETGSPKHSFLDFTLGLEIGLKLEDQFPKLGGATSWVEAAKIWREKYDVMLAPLQLFIPWT